MAAALPTRMTPTPTQALEACYAVLAKELADDETGQALRAFEAAIVTRRDPSKVDETLALVSDIATSLMLSTFEKRTMDKASAIAIATYAVVLLKNCKDRDSFYLPRRETLLPRALFYDPIGQKLTVIADREMSVISSKLNGTRKAVTSAALICLRNPPRQAAQKALFAFTRISTQHPMWHCLTREVTLFSSVTPSARNVISSEASRINLPEAGQGDLADIVQVFKAYESDIFKLTTEKHGLRASFLQKLLIASQLIDGLFFLHSKGIAHGDVKLENCLFEITEDLQVRAAICDLGFAFMPGKNQPPSFSLDLGFYGTIAFSAPELYGRIGYLKVKHTPEEYFLLDIFALGILLYLFLLKERGEPAWMKLIDNSAEAFKRTGKHEDSPQLKAAVSAICAQITTEIEVPLAELLKQQAPLTVSQSLHKLIYSMLRLDPHKRMDLVTAKKVIAEIIAQYKISIRQPLLRPHPSAANANASVNPMRLPPSGKGPVKVFHKIARPPVEQKSRPANRPSGYPTDITNMLAAKMARLSLRDTPRPSPGSRGHNPIRGKK